MITANASVVFTVVKTTSESRYGETVEWTLHIESAIKDAFDDLDGFTYGNYAKGCSPEQYGPLNAPLWDMSQHVHDWRDYVDRATRDQWDALDDVSRMLYIWQWSKEASAEEWD
jgi:hypothetical protein